MAVELHQAVLLAAEDHLEVLTALHLTASEGQLKILGQSDWTLHEQNQNANNRKDVAIDELEREVVELKAAQQLQGFYAQGLVESLEEERALEVRRAEIASFATFLKRARAPRVLSLHENPERVLTDKADARGCQDGKREAPASAIGIVRFPNSFPLFGVRWLLSVFPPTSSSDFVPAFLSAQTTLGEAAQRSRVRQSKQIAGSCTPQCSHLRETGGQHHRKRRPAPPGNVPIPRIVPLT